MLTAVLSAPAFGATTIDEVLEPPGTPGNAWSGTFIVTPSETLWAFGVANDQIQDTSISGIASIDGLEANDHWISALISRTGWDNGFDFDGIRPIGATPPSSFSMTTNAGNWQWGTAGYVAFYWLSEAGSDAANPLAVLQPNESYDAFKFFTSGPASPFAAFAAADGNAPGAVILGETAVTIVPLPAGVYLFAGGLLALWVPCAGRPDRSRRSPRRALHSTALTEFKSVN